MKDYIDFCIERFMLTSRAQDFPDYERENKKTLIEDYMHYLRGLAVQEAHTNKRKYLAREAQIARQKNALLDEQASRRANA